MGIFHTSRMLGGCKFDPRLINTKCTITLEDVALQLSLSVDGSVITRETIVPSKEDICTKLLEKVPNKFDGGRISMNWLAKNFDKLPTDATEVIKEQYA
ncbi:hypothetical protein Gohar_006661 [Gossypium harknessii]|uniref:Uncharacterized protein n=1 Tax=Gossypium harknessii TaxID=34285 RepID=A0A7J9GE52_9ROSI|nr:hypothetical protein [Gossypium harknessii]